MQLNFGHWLAATLLAGSVCCTPAAAQVADAAPSRLPPAVSDTEAEADVRSRLKAADDIFNAGDHAGALVLMAQARQHARERLGPDAVLTLHAELDHAATLMHLGRLAESRAELDPLLQRAVRLLGPEHPIALDALNNLANLVDTQEGTHAALPLYEQAYELRMRAQGETDRHAIHALNDLAYGLMQTGELHRALPLMQRVLRLRLQTEGAAHPWTLTAHNNLGVLYERLGRPGESRLQHETALRLRLEHLGERHPETLVSMNNLARALHDFGAQDEGLDLVTRALDLMEQALGPRHFSTLDARQNRASFLAQQGRAAEARTALEAVVADRAATQSLDHPRRLSALITLAEVLTEQGEIEPAAASLDEAEARLSATVGAEHPLMVAARAARVRLLLPRFPDRAAVLAQETAQLATRSLGELHDQTLELRAMGLQAQLAAGRWRQSMDELQPLLAALERAHAAVPASDTGVRLRWQRRHRLAHQLVVTALIQAGELEQAWSVLERTRARNLQDTLDDRALARAAGVPGEAWQRLQEHRERALGLGLMLARGIAAEERQRLLAARTSAVEAAARMEAELLQQHPLYGSSLVQRATMVPIERQPARQRIDPQQARIAFVVLDGLAASAGVERQPILGALVQRSTGRPVWARLGSAGDWAASARALAVWTGSLGQRYPIDADGRRLAIVKTATPAGTQRWDAGAAGAACDGHTTCRTDGVDVWGTQAYEHLTAAFSRGLLEPLERHLTGATRWHISTDPVLAAVPWDLLPWKGRPLAESVAVVIETRGRSVVQSARKRQPARSLWAIGAPDFVSDARTPSQAKGEGEPGRRRSAMRTAGIPAALLDAQGHLAMEARAWQPLPGTSHEMAWSAAHFRRQGGTARVVSGNQATETRVRQASTAGELAQADVLLFSTHAFFNEREPRHSAVVLHRDGPEAERDGYLTPTEIVGLHLDAELSVLSACGTGQGTRSTADAAAGFAYALQVAGSRRSLLTLWPVNDRTAAVFVSALMDRLARGEAPELALQRTKREFMQHPNQSLRSPRHWAAFVMHGG